MKRNIYTIILFCLTLVAFAHEPTPVQIEDNNTEITTTIITSDGDIERILSNATLFVNGSGDIEVKVNNETTQIGASLYTVTGRKLDGKSLSMGGAIFSRDMFLGRGLYIVTLESGQSMYSHKIIVE